MTMAAISPEARPPFFFFLLERGATDGAGVGAADGSGAGPGVGPGDGAGDGGTGVGTYVGLLVGAKTQDELKNVNAAREAARYLDAR